MTQSTYDNSGLTTDRLQTSYNCTCTRTRYAYNCCAATDGRCEMCKDPKILAISQSLKELQNSWPFVSLHPPNFVQTSNPWRPKREYFVWLWEPPIVCNCISQPPRNNFLVSLHWDPPSLEYVITSHETDQIRCCSWHCVSINFWIGRNLATRVYGCQALSARAFGKYVSTRILRYVLHCCLSEEGTATGSSSLSSEPWWSGSTTPSQD